MWGGRATSHKDTNKATRAAETAKNQKTMKLTEEDYKKIASQMEEGTATVEYEKDGEVLVVDYILYLDGYVEDDYFNGTGAWVETDRYFAVTDAVSFDSDGAPTDNDFDASRLEKLVA